MEKVSKRTNAILEVKESVALLSQLLQGYRTESCSQSHRELVQVSTARHVQTSCRSRAEEQPGHENLSVPRISTSAVRRCGPRCSD